MQGSKLRAQFENAGKKVYSTFAVLHKQVLSPVNVRATQHIKSLPKAYHLAGKCLRRSFDLEVNTDNFSLNTSS